MAQLYTAKTVSCGPCLCFTGSSFPSDQCFTGSSFPAGFTSCFTILPWQPNKMATGHKTHKLGRQSSNDHNCQIWFTSLHVLWRKCNLTILISHFKSMRPFSCHSNQTKSQITIILPIFKSSYLNNISS